MSEDTEIFKIIADYFADEITPADRQTLNEWIKNPENKRVFKQFAQANYLYTSQEQGEIISINKNNSSLRKSILKYAAVFLLLLSLGAVWKFAFSKNTKPSSEYLSIAINGDFKTIENSDGASFLTDDNKIKFASLENGTLKMLQNNTKNQLTINVPNGKNLKVLLVDGSEITLNSGTQLSFESNFIKNDSRIVNLKGEAFFEVSKDPTHPFIVMTDHFTTKVLGTKFNISSYKDENEAFVNLVEGKIEVSGVKVAVKKILTPGEKISFSPKSKISNIEAADPLQDMDWLNKEIAFDNNTTDEVLSKIERVYGLQIVRKDVVLENSHFSGTFKIENLDQITHSLELLLNCKIQKEGNKLILNPNK